MNTVVTTSASAPSTLPIIKALDPVCVSGYVVTVTEQEPQYNDIDHNYRLHNIMIYDNE